MAVLTPAERLEQVECAASMQDYWGKRNIEINFCQGKKGEKWATGV